MSVYCGMRLGVLVWSRSAAEPLMYMKRNGVVVVPRASTIALSPENVYS